MCSFTSAILLLTAANLLSLSLPTAAQVGLTPNCRRMHARCAFKFAGENPSDGPKAYPPFGLASDTPFTPRIVSRNASVTLGVVQMNGIVPRVIFGTGSAPISNFGSPPFVDTQLKPVPVPFGPRTAGGYGSAIALQAEREGQSTISSSVETCVIAWFTQFQVLRWVDGRYQVVDNRNAVQDDWKCVVFLTPASNDRR